MAVYLLHYTGALERSGSRGVRHYIGYARNADVFKRIASHEHGTSGAKLPLALRRAGATPVPVRIWPDAGRDFERYLKFNGHYSRLCPLCREIELQSARSKQWARRHSKTR